MQFVLITVYAGRPRPLKTSKGLLIYIIHWSSITIKPPVDPPVQVSLVGFDIPSSVSTPE